MIENLTKEVAYCPKCRRRLSAAIFGRPMTIQLSTLREVTGFCDNCRCGIEIHQRFDRGIWVTISYIQKSNNGCQTGESENGCSFGIDIGSPEGDRSVEMLTPAVVIGQGEYKREFCIA